MALPQRSEWCLQVKPNSGFPDTQCQVSPESQTNLKTCFFFLFDCFYRHDCHDLNLMPIRVTSTESVFFLPLRLQPLQLCLGYWLGLFTGFIPKALVSMNHLDIQIHKHMVQKYQN